MSPSIESKIQGTRSGHVIREFFTNSAHFPIINIIIELLHEGPAKVLAGDLAFYALLFAAGVQAWVLGTWRYRGTARSFLGNLIGPSCYTVVELMTEGMDFFFHPNHLAYWGFSLALGGLQELRDRLPERAHPVPLVAESIVRTSMILAGYWIFGSLAEPENPAYGSFQGFVLDKSHLFLVIVTVLVGLLLGLERLNAETYLSMLRSTAARLKEYSQWFLGRDLLSRAVSDPGALTLKRRKRAIVFMDIRGFTAWSETQPPETVVGMLNAYYETAASVWEHNGALKTKFTADEIMNVFPEVEAAVRTALEYQRVVAPLLEGFGLSAGIGVHSGILVEGLLGSRDVKGYDVIGDTVNTTKRICSEAAGNEILISRNIFDIVPTGLTVSPPRELTVKGKSETITVYPLTGIR